MRPSDIYKSSFKLPWWETYDSSERDGLNEEVVCFLTYGFHNHLPELVEEDIRGAATDRVRVRLHFNPYIDGNRIAVVGSVWFDEKPVMVIRHAGRSGNDYKDRFITDLPLFNDMVSHIREVMTHEDPHEDDVVKPDDDIKALDDFYVGEMAIVDGVMVGPS